MPFFYNFFMKNLEIGKIGEQYAEKFLISKNYEILKNNYRCRYGEIDIIAFDDIHHHRV